MSKRVEVVIKNILPAHSHGAYTLVLQNPESKMQLPVLIGAVEAQSIAMEMEDMKPSRPLTHDLFTSVISEFEISIKEIVIEKLEEGIYFSSILFEQNGKSHKIDSRTSDAIALAMKNKAPIFVMQHIIDEAAFVDDNESEDELTPGREGSKSEFNPPPSSLSTDNPFEEFELEDLEFMLQEAIADEDYARAARIRDEISKRK